MTLLIRDFSPVPAAPCLRTDPVGQGERHTKDQRHPGERHVSIPGQNSAPVTVSNSRTSPVSGAVVLAGPGLTCCAISRPGRREGGDKPMILASAER
jgi:hypothetical protein